MEKVKFAQGEILWHFLLKVENVVLDVKPHNLAHGQVRDLIYSEHGESLKDKFMLVVVDDCRVFDQEVGWRRDGHPAKIR